MVDTSKLTKHAMWLPPQNAMNPSTNRKMLFHMNLALGVGLGGYIPESIYL